MATKSNKRKAPKGFVEVTEKSAAPQGFEEVTPSQPTQPTKPSAGSFIGTAMGMGGKPPTPANVWHMMAESLTDPENVGGMIGGASMGAMGGGLPGAIIGAGIGGVGGEFTKQLGETWEYPAISPYMTYEEMFRRKEDVPREVPIDPKALAMAGGRQAAYEVVGHGLAKVPQKMLAPFAHKVTPAAKEAIDYLSQFTYKMPRTITKTVGKERFPLAPAEATRGFLMDTMHNIAKGSIFGGGRSAKYEMWRAKYMHPLVIEDLGRKFGEVLDEQQLADAMIGFFRGEFDAATIAAEPLYNSAFNLAGDIPIPMKGVLDFAQKEAGLITKAGNIAPSVSGIANLRKVLKLGDEIPFSVAKETRSLLLSEIRRLERTAGKGASQNAVRRINGLIGEIDRSIETTLAKESPDALGWWRGANKLIKEGYEEYNDDMIRSLIKSADPKKGGDPQILLGRIFKPKTPQLRLRLKKTLGPQRWKQFKAWYVESLMNQAVVETQEGVFLDAIKMDNLLFGKTGMGEKRLKMLFDGDEFIYLKRAVKSLALTQEPQAPPGMGAKGTGLLAIQFAQPRSLMRVSTMPLQALGIGATARAGEYGTAAVILGAPWVLARAFTNPTIARYLTIGLHQMSPKAIRTTAGVNANIGRAVNLMGRLQQRYEKEELDNEE